MDFRALLRTCANGSSELMSNLSMSLVSMIYNFQLMRYAGDDGIAAYGVLMYVNFVFISVYIGFSVGSAPLVGYHHGAANHQELKNLLRKGISILAILAVAMTAAGELLAVPLSKVFVGYDQELLDMTVRGFRIYTLSFLLCGFNIYGSAFFTALNNGLISAVISFMRTLICQIAAVFLLPLLLGLDGIWWSILAAEVMALTLTSVFMIVFRKKYHYG
jgi:Na+-driven multidrug efflux pump